MAGIAGIAHWGSNPVPGDLVDGMLAVIRHRGPDGLHAETRKNVALGHARFVLSERERNKTQPVWLPDGSCGLVADARLYNREELLGALGSIPWCGDTPSDGELLLAAYARWGEQAVIKLRGDFAFAIWDERKGQLFAARDPFGLKPFFYHTDSHGIRFGSEPKQLLCLPGVTAKPDDRVIADYLFHGVPRAFEETFFAGINRLRAGHMLIAGENSVTQKRFWPAPTPPEDFRGSPEECAEHFSVLFRESVRRRLETDALAAMELSGGYDSSAVVLVAAEIYKSRSPSPSRPLTISQTYPRFACDESAYIAAVAAQTGFENLYAAAPCEDFTPGLIAEMQKVDAPTPEIYWQRRADIAALLHGRGCKLLVSGLGGDELVWDPNYELDLLRSRRYLSVVRYCLSDPRVVHESGTRTCLRRLIGHFVPRPVKRLLRRRRAKRVDTSLDWINPELLEKYRSYLARDAFSGDRPIYPDLARDAICRGFTDPGFLRTVEQEECLSAYTELELRHAFLDQDLVEFVLSIPFETRLQLPGPFKSLLTAALGERLPAKVRLRGSKTVFNEYFLGLLAKSWPVLLNAVSDTANLASRPYIDAEMAAKRWNRPISPNLTWFGSARALWQPVLLEIWLRNHASRHKIAH